MALRIDRDLGALPRRLAFVYPYLFGVVVLWMWAGIVYGAGQSTMTTRAIGDRLG